MDTSTRKSHYLRGLTAGAPFILVAAPFGMLFGVVAIEAGLSLIETMVFTTAVIAGAAQFAAIGQMVDHAPVLVVILTALAVNLRMAMYSASLALYLGPAPFWQRAFVAYFNFDQTYAMSVAEYEKHPEMTVPQRVAYFFGTTTLLVPTWVGSSYLGAVLGGAIP
ncbi:MAG: AzlC family ABC transporter permease, partial [Rhodobacteraceae bacterium]|nr:AzlC family ABC transporter permease [Paracoccaceae bacterium]